MNLRNMLKDKPMLHSFRKWSITKLASPNSIGEVLHKDIALLAGHRIVGSTAFKFYVGKNRENILQNLKTALAYKKTPLFELDTKSLEQAELLNFKEDV